MTANANPLPTKYGDFDFPRRAIVEAMHQAETAIRAAMFEVEALGADPLLTDAGTKLIAAKDLVSDWLEGKSGLAAAPVAAQEPEGVVPEDYKEATQDTFCDAFCTWRDHHPKCERNESQPAPAAIDGTPQGAQG